MADAKPGPAGELGRPSRSALAFIEKSARATSMAGLSNKRW
jgi:hypothetical protein